MLFVAQPIATIAVFEPLLRQLVLDILLVVGKFLFNLHPLLFQVRPIVRKAFVFCLRPDHFFILLFDLQF